MALNKRERILLGVTIGSLVVGVSYLLISPLTKAWTSLQRDTTTQQGELRMITATIERKSGWQREYDALRGSLGKTSKFASPTDVLKKVQEVGTAAGVQIINSSELHSVEKDVYRELPVKCTFEATTESLVKFLHALQTGAGLMSVEQLQVTPRTDNSCILRCDIQVRALSGKTEESGT
jgi:Tfp pilus assembly protein PilO